ncbi:hypothetical protein BH11PAT3_BH11PAT3_0740 [soil metagenome]
MPVVRISCLPADLTEAQLRDLHRAIVIGAVSVPEVGLKDETTMTVLFPSDMMSYGLGTEIIIEVISGVFGEKHLGHKVRSAFADAMVLAVKKFHPQSMVECFILPHNRTDGFSHSRASENYETTEARLRSQVGDAPQETVEPSGPEMSRQKCKG